MPKRASRRARAKLAGLPEPVRSSSRRRRSSCRRSKRNYAQLNRDYDVQKKTYESLLARRESAAMGKDVQDTGGAQFRVIDPPRVSPQPVSPNRIALLGIAFAAVDRRGSARELRRQVEIMPTFHDARSLREVTQAADPRHGVDAAERGAAAAASAQRVSVRRRLGGLFAAFTAVFAFALLVGACA